jgi:hypothetical protein
MHVCDMQVQRAFESLTQLTVNNAAGVTVGGAAAAYVTLYIKSISSVIGLFYIT